MQRKSHGSGCGIAEHSDSSFAGKYRLIATSSTSIVMSFASLWNWMEWFMTDRNRQRKIGSDTHVYSNWDTGRDPDCFAEMIRVLLPHPALRTCE